MKINRAAVGKIQGVLLTVGIGQICLIFFTVALPEPLFNRKKQAGG